MYRPVHFEIPAENPQRAIDFYTTCFGWTFHKWEGGQWDYWMISTGDPSLPGINGGLMPRHSPAQPCVNTINVPNLDQAVETILANGGQIALPKMPVPGVGWLAYIKDTEGHILGLMQQDQSVTI